MNIVTLDFETYFDNDYSLSKMTTEAYIRDPRFEVLGVGLRGVCLGEPYSYWYTDTEFRKMLTDKRLDFTNSAVLAHHAQFEGLILSHHFDVRPALWLDTLSMGRMVLGNHLSVALASLAKHFDLSPKNVPYDLFKGKRWHELTPDARRQVADGCLHDVDLTWAIFSKLARGFPPEEIQTIDWTIRAFTEPRLVGDIDLLAQVWMDEDRRKRTMLDELGVTASDLQSAERFAELLRAEGIEPEMKDGKNGDIFAFAKTDEFMKELQEDDGRPGDLARARLGVKSTIDQTRAESLGYMATRGTLPVYLRYSGAHTTRWSGGDGVNWQNLRRGSDLRRSIQAPGGFRLASIDLSQIEARILDTWAGQADKVEKWRQGVDQYSELATGFYGYPVSRATPMERQFGKVLKLQCGFGSGGATIVRAARRATPPVILTDAEGEEAKALYRAEHPRVVDLWGTAGRMLARIGGGPPLQWGPVLIEDKHVVLPNGAFINYETLEYCPDWSAWRMRRRNGWSKLYGAKLVENVVQALARVVLSQAILRIKAKHGLRPVLCTHDDAGYLLPEADAERLFPLLIAEFKVPPAWMPELPLDAEGVLGERYGK